MMPTRAAVPAEKPVQTTNYRDFLVSKRRIWTGQSIAASSLPSALFDWQAAIVRWALRKGRAAVFADCGLGKTYMQLSWAQAVPGRVLVLAPLCVAEQTVAEGVKLGVPVVYARTSAEAPEARIVITNYERLENFDPADFAGVVLDESSILKAFDGKTRQRLIETFQGTTYRLCCTATPSPNDIAELANHAEFLGLMTRAEFLATWFVHDSDTGWRMKGHAVEPFYRWMASWAVALRRPSDVGYSDAGFELPPLRIHEVVVEGGGDGTSLFPEFGLKGIGGRLSARRGSLEARIDAAVNLIDERGASWIAWCGLNTESDALASAVPKSVNVQGSDDYDDKVSAIQAFVAGRTRVLITKAKIAGFGLNLQHCSKMAFVGLSDSYETYYQCIRRCWRFGQKQPVDVHIIVSDAERGIVENVRRKETAAQEMSLGLIEHMRDFEREELIA
jgi:superfamily II DNA or RNA helicase